MRQNAEQSYVSQRTDGASEHLPELVQYVMLAAPTTYLVAAGQATPYRGTGIDVVWPQFLAILAIAGVLFAASLRRFRKAISLMVCIPDRPPKRPAGLLNI